jgi:hypothetical protein
MPSDPRALILAVGAGTVVGIVLCRIFVVRRVKRLLRERPGIAFVTRHVDTPGQQATT